MNLGIMVVDSVLLGAMEWRILKEILLIEC